MNHLKTLLNTTFVIIISGMFKIIPLENLIGKILSENDFTGISPTGKVSYSWGDNIELNQWIKAKDKEVEDLMNMMQYMKDFMNGSFFKNI